MKRRQRRLRIKLVGLAVLAVGVILLAILPLVGGVSVGFYIFALALILIGSVAMASPDAASVLIDLLLSWWLS